MYLTMLLGGSVIVCGALYASHYYQPRDALVQGVVQTISIMTSTGFTTANFSQWPTFLPLFLVVLSFFGGCAGSTGGGIKIGRMLLLAQQGLRELYRLVHPSALRPIKIRGRRVPDRVLDAVWAFFGVYLVTFYVMVLILLATGLDYVTAWSCTAAAINNMGPGLGAAAVNYGDLNLFAKWVLCAGMLLGRLELFTLLVLFTPAYWRG